MTPTQPRIRISQLVLACAITTAAGGDTITLRGSVRLAPGATEVRLADIAVLDGPLAERHADVVVATLVAGGRAMEIAPATVRERLEEVGIHWGKVQLGGSRVIVRPPAPGTAGPPLAMTALAIDTPAAQRRPAPREKALEAVTLLMELTLRGTVTDRIVNGMRISPNDVRLIFNDRDKQYLATPLDGQRFEIQPLSSFASDRIDLRIRAWEAGRIRDNRTVTVRPRVRIGAAVARRELDRNQELRDTDFSVEERWVSPSQANLMCSLVSAVGRVTDDRIKPGQVLRKSDLRREVLIQRGDRVMIPYSLTSCR